MKTWNKYKGKPCMYKKKNCGLVKRVMGIKDDERENVAG